MRNIQSALQYRWYKEVWNENREASIKELMAEDVVIHGLAEGEMYGVKGFITFYEGFRGQFKDIHVKLDEVIAEDDMECGLCAVTATHIQSGNPVKFGGTSITRVKDGKIAEAWNNFDFYSMYLQLGYTLSQP